MKLLELNLKNFKGIKDFTFKPNGENAEISGDNATGKTTLADGQTWLLFDKDSHGNKKFEIKTLDSNGKAASGMTHEVEGVYLLDDGAKITLKKAYFEKFTKKRGSPKATFTGHTTEYWVDSVPVKLKEYKEAVAKIAAEDVFRLLTTPSYFAEQIHWQERRSLLIDICGDVSDNDVIVSNAKLKELPAIIGTRSLEDHKKVVISTRQEVNKKLDSIPTKIQENRHDLPDVEGLNRESEISNRDTLSISITEKEQEIIRLKTNDAADDVKKELVKAETTLQTCINEDTKSLRKITTVLDEKIRLLLSDKGNSDREITTNNSFIPGKRTSIDGNEQKMIILREQYSVVEGDVFEDVDGMTCPTCTQVVDYNIQLEIFNVTKASRLEMINDEGMPLKKQVEIWEAEIAVLVGEIETSQKKSDRLTLEIADLNTEIAQAKEDSTSDATKDADKEVIRIKAKLDNIKAGDVTEEVDKADKEFESLVQQRKDVIDNLLKLDEVEKADKRDAELQEEEKKLSADFERLESELFLIEEFIRTKVSMLEEKINGHFKIARFKLFEEQINEGLRECCEVLGNGVGYSSGLNNAARINTGIDIISTLSKHYGVSMPLIVDNKEAINQLAEIDTQVISLVVSHDKKLTVK